MSFIYMFMELILRIYSMIVNDSNPRDKIFSDI